MTPLATITIIGQVHGGKNSMKVTRTGRHYPNRLFEQWRNHAVFQTRLHYHGKPITEPVKATIHYTAQDRRRRDVPAILDALWHVLERAGVVADDCLIRDVDFTTDYDKHKPSVKIVLTSITL